MSDRRGIILTREELEAWSDYDLTDEQVERVEQVIQFSSIPEAIATIVENVIAEEAQKRDAPPK